MRRMDSCLNCQQLREIAAGGLCFACYRREKRANEQWTGKVDRHNPAVRKEHKQIFRGFNNLMRGASDLGLSMQDILTIRAIIEPYLEPIAKFLSVPTEPDNNTTTVNGEPVDISVHRSQQAEKE